MRFLVRSNVGLTALFMATTAFEVAVFSPAARAVGVAVALCLFALGVAAFIWGYFSAVQRSRSDEISVGSLYFLTGQVATRTVRRTMNGCLVAQLVIGIGGAFLRSSTEGRPGSTLAFGVLVPLLGIGLNGLWASRFGRFTARELPDRQE